MAWDRSRVGAQKEREEEHSCIIIHVQMFIRLVSKGPILINPVTSSLLACWIFF